MARQIIGVQVHHSSVLNDAYRNLVNGVQSLKGAVEMTGDPELLELVEQATAVLRRVGRKQEAASAYLQQLHKDDPERFVRCREGFEPWPDETLIGFEPRCTCHDVCQIHDNGRPDNIGWECKCVQCPAHPEVQRT